MSRTESSTRFSWKKLKEIDDDALQELSSEAITDLVLESAIQDQKGFMQELEQSRDPKLLALLPGVLRAHQIEGMEINVSKLRCIFNDPEWQSTRKPCFGRF